MAKCPWCQKPTGVSYANLTRTASTPSKRDLEAMAEHRERDLNANDWSTLIAMSNGPKVLRVKSHAWLENGATVGSYTIWKLEGKGLISRRHQHFTEGRIGTAWDITDSGRETVEKFLEEKVNATH
jgi:DNA-binding MarR family transcriptional regulator